MLVPGGVPQHILRSSMCSTSRPINHEPRDTSSLAYLCNIGLHQNYHLQQFRNIHEIEIPCYVMCKIDQLVSHSERLQHSGHTTRI